jgi:hypothetical protein
MNAARKRVKDVDVLSDDGSGIDDEDRGKSRVLIAVRVPPSLEKYIERKARPFGRGGPTKIVEESIRMHRRLGERLDPYKLRIQQFALDERLSWPSQEHEALSRLILRGLEDAERRRK